MAGFFDLQTVKLSAFVCDDCTREMSSDGLLLNFKRVLAEALFVFNDFLWVYLLCYVFIVVALKWLVVLVNGIV